MHCGRLQPKHVSFQSLLEMSVVHVLSHVTARCSTHEETQQRNFFCRLASTSSSAQLTEGTYQSAKTTVTISDVK